jgi:hypothetical protein
MLVRTFCWAVGFSILAFVSGPGATWAHADWRAAGSEIGMVQVESTYPTGYNGKLSAVIDDRGEALARFQFADSRGTVMTFTPDELRKGVVLLHAVGKDILKISSPKFTNDGGGQMILTFLKNFFGNDRREVRFDYLRRGAMTDWLLQTDDQKGKDPFDLIRVGVYKNLGVPAGVAAITLLAGEQVVRKYNPNDLPPGQALLGGVDGLPEFLPAELFF